MDSFKEFQANDLDSCIAQAIKWFDIPREALEIEILQDAKSGIFGIVGARKAKIRARRAHVAEAVRDILGKADGRASGIAQAPRPGAQSRERGAEGTAERANVRPERHEAQGSAPRQEFAEPGEEAEDEDQDGAPIAPVNLDLAQFEKLATDIIGRLAAPIAGREISMQVDLADGKPRIKIDWDGDAGLMIGRDGQTLAALQYMGSRLLSRALGAPVRIQLDIGQYRSRQDEKLRELARSLAEKARQTGKPVSTRPLSSYHRRIVHMSLKDEPDIQTRSAGEGVMKRVVILPERS